MADRLSRVVRIDAEKGVGRHKNGCSSASTNRLLPSRSLKVSVLLNRPCWRMTGYSEGMKIAQESPRPWRSVRLHVWRPT
jgi:hypothetical protein